MTTTTRLLRLLSLLQTRRDWPGPLLASRLQTTDRTVRRDIERLRELGYSIRTTMGPDGGYRLDAGTEVPPLLLDDDQAVAVAVALQTVALTGAGVADAAIRALATVRQVMPTRLRHRTDALRVTAVGRAGDGPPPGVSAEVLLALAEAIRACEVLRFDYVARGAPDAPDGDSPPAPPRRAEPLHLVASHGRWYLLGWDLDREDWRLYGADRVRPRSPNGPRFTPRTVPGGDVDAFVSARFKGSDVDRWRCRGTVIVELPASKVVPFAGDATVTVIDGERCAVEAGSWSWGALAASFGRFEAPLHVVGPPELVTAFGALAARYRAACDGESNPHHHEQEAVP